jgi:hypothetical protein
MSDLEDTLDWHMKVAGLPEWEREYVFYPGRKFRFDFAFLPFRLGVEVMGGIYSGGRHTTGAGYAKDCEKLNLACIQGWRVLYVTSDMIKDGRALDYVMRALGTS